MPSQGLGLAPRLRYLAGRARRIDVGSVARAREGGVGAARQVDARGRRRHAVAGGLPQRRLPGLHRLRLRDPEPRRARDVHDAPGLEPAVAEVRPPRLPRTSSRTRSSSTASSRSTCTASGWSSRRATPTRCARSPQRQGTIVTKEPVGQAGTGVHRYHAADVEDWEDFHRGLLRAASCSSKRSSSSIADLAAVCPGTVNTTRVTAFFDGEQTHILAMAQKFGRGAVERPDDVRRLLHDARRRRPRRRRRATTPTGTCTRCTRTPAFGSRTSSCR